MSVRRVTWPRCGQEWPLRVQQVHLSRDAILCVLAVRVGEELCVLAAGVCEEL
jgi:hypothetical protein